MVTTYLQNNFSKNNIVNESALIKLGGELLDIMIKISPDIYVEICDYRMQTESLIRRINESIT